MPTDYTLLYTDVVDSTAVNTRLGDAGMAELWGEHDRRSRELLRQWHGIEVDRSDGFLALFDRPPDALGFIDAYHRMLQTLPVPLRARAGVHVGPLLKRENLPSEVQLGAKAVEVVGIAKAYASRLMALAQGGQTLASPSAQAALQAAGALNGPWRSVSHGHWRLKGVDSVIEIFEIGDARSAFVPPADSDKSQRVVQIGGAWVGVREVPHNLPGERDSFVGRGEELKSLAQQFVEDARLVTVTGPGGMGKTRLALRYAWSWLGDHPGGLWFCDLSSARGADGLLFAVGQGLEVPLGNDPLAQIGRAIAGRGRCLVILDNFEQVRRHARDTLGRWLDAAPQARFIVTSREVLGLPGERTLSLAPLTTDEAAALFHQRARAAHAGHDPQAEPEATRELVELLDGMPLAIELAAPRVRVMPTGELLARMGNRFRLLTAAGGRPDRQATLRTTLAWSWDLLSAEERAVLAQLSVFEGGFAWQAVQAVVGLADHGDEDAPWIIDLLQSLVDKSLVAPQLGARFNLLRSVKEFASAEMARPDSFPGSGPALLSAAQRRHAAHYAGLNVHEAIAGHCVELDNLVRACEQSIAENATEQALACLRLAWAALRMAGPFAQAVQLADSVRAMPGMDDRLAVWVDHIAGRIWLARGDGEQARKVAERALALAQGRDELAALAAVKCLLGEVEIGAGNFPAAERWLLQARDAAERSENAEWQRQVLNGLGALYQYQGENTRSRTCYSEALTIAFTSGDMRGQAALLGNLAGVYFTEGKLEPARQAFEQTLNLARQIGDRRLEGNCRCNLGLIHHEQGNHAAATSELSHALTLARKLGYARLAHVALCNLGLVAESTGDQASAREYFTAAREGANSSKEVRSEAHYCAYLAQAHSRLNAPEEARYNIDRARLLLGDRPDPMGWALLECSEAELLHHCGEHAASIAALARARAIQAEQKWKDDSELGRRLRLSERFIRQTSG